MAKLIYTRENKERTIYIDFKHEISETLVT